VLRALPTPSAHRPVGHPPAPGQGDPPRGALGSSRGGRATRGPGGSGLSAVPAPSSLVRTNERLLQELDQVRAQHQAEVEQLHWSYKELKKTLARFPGSPRDARPASPPRAL